MSNAWPRRFLAVLAGAIVSGCSVVDYGVAQYRNSVDAYVEFFMRHPSSSFAPKVLQRIEDLRWEGANSLGTIPAYQEYLGTSYGRSHRDDAWSKIAAIAKKDAPFRAPTRVCLDVRLAPPKGEDSTRLAPYFESVLELMLKSALAYASELGTSPEGNCDAWMSAIGVVVKPVCAAYGRGSADAGRWLCPTARLDGTLILQTADQRLERKFSSRAPDEAPHAVRSDIPINDYSTVYRALAESDFVHHAWTLVAHVFGVWPIVRQIDESSVHRAFDAVSVHGEKTELARGSPGWMLSEVDGAQARVIEDEAKKKGIDLLSLVFMSPSLMNKGGFIDSALRNTSNATSWITKVQGELRKCHGFMKSEADSEKASLNETVKTKCVEWLWLESLK